ncbi:MerR family transcriptional regulator [Actinomadura kijaniata]|uniref:MerR family transcriptional regulator n=1 Tax=Actinomadura kijaniata TaxID=46161 RepID=UPI003F1BD64E
MNQHSPTVGGPPGTGDLPIDDRHAPLYSIGQVAAMLNVQPPFLRRLEQQQVVQPQRSAGGQRRYSRQEIEQIRQVIRLTGEGLTPAAACRILHLQQQLAHTRRQLSDLQRHLRHHHTPTERPGTKTRT